MESVHSTAVEMTAEEMHSLLRKVSYGHLGLAFENEAYVVPVSHFYDGNKVWFKVSTEGKTTTYLQANAQACFQVDELVESQWGSVICYGTVSLSDSEEQKSRFRTLASRQGTPEADSEHMDVLICTFTIEEMTGRKTAGYSG